MRTRGKLDFKKLFCYIWNETQNSNYSFFTFRKQENMTKILPQAKLGALNDGKKRDRKSSSSLEIFPFLVCSIMQRYTLPILGESFLEQKGGSLFSSAPASLSLQSLFSRHLSLLFVTMDETSGSLRAEASELWKSHSQFSEFLTLKKLFPLFLKRDLAQIL